MPAEPDADPGWIIHDEQGFAGLIGPIWERRVDDNGFELALTLGVRHANQAGIAQGGLLVTLADRIMGHSLRHALNGQPVATIQLDTHFMAPGQIGRVIYATARITRTTRQLAFIDGWVRDAECELFSARGIWKRLADPDGVAADAFRARFTRQP